MWFIQQVLFILTAQHFVFSTSAESPWHTDITSVATLQQLFALDIELVDHLAASASHMQNNINALRSYISQIRAKQAAANPDREQYLANPLNSYSLVRHMHSDWTHWRHRMEKPMGIASMKKMRSLLPKLPSAEDYQEAQRGILRLQKDHGYTAENFISGLLAGVQYNTKFSPLETLEMGQFTYDEHLHDLSATWLNVTLAGLDQLSTTELKVYEVLQVVDLEPVLMLYANTAFHSENYVAALSAMDRVVALRPYDENMKTARELIELNYLKKKSDTKPAKQP